MTRDPWWDTARIGWCRRVFGTGFSIDFGRPRPRDPEVARVFYGPDAHRKAVADRRGAPTGGGDRP